MSVLLLLGVFSFVFAGLLRDYQLRAGYHQQTEFFYTGMTIEALAVNDIRRRLKTEDATLPKEGEYIYNYGTVRYRISETKINVTTRLNKSDVILENQVEWSDLEKENNSFPLIESQETESSQLEEELLID